MRAVGIRGMDRRGYIRSDQPDGATTDDGDVFAFHGDKDTVRSTPYGGRYDEYAVTCQDPKRRSFRPPLSAIRMTRVEISDLTVSCCVEDTAAIMALMSALAFSIVTGT